MPMTVTSTGYPIDHAYIHTILFNNTPKNLSIELYFVKTVVCFPPPYGIRQSVEKYQGFNLWLNLEHADL